MTEKRIRVRLDAGNTSSDIKGLNNDMTGLGRTADGVQKGFTSLKGVFIAVTAALATGKIAQYSDSWTKLNNQIKQTTDTTKNALAVQEAIFNIAKDSRVELVGVAEAYQRISNSVSEYGFSAEDTLNVVEGLTKAFKANGTTAQEVSSVLVQLGQGLGSGALQGEELKAILEASLPVSRAIAKEFGVTTGKLKDLGAAGQLTTERVFKALQSSLPEFESAFSKASVTIAEGIQVGENSITRLIGEINTATGAGETLANGLVDLSKSIDFLSDAVASGAAGKIAEVFQTQLDLVGNDVNTTSEYIAKVWNDLGNEITSDTKSSTLDISDAFLNIIPNVRTLVQTITVEIASAADKLGVYAEAVAATLNPFDDVSVNQARGAFGRQIDQLDEVREAALQSIFDQRQAEQTAQSARIAEAEVLLAKYKEQREARALTLGDIPAGVGGGVAPPLNSSSGGGTDNSEDFEKFVSAEKLKTQFLRDEILLRQQLELDNATQEEESFQLDILGIAQQYELRTQAILENEKLSSEQKDILMQELFEQEAEAQRLRQQQLTNITQEGEDKRTEVELLAQNARISNLQSGASSALSLLGAFGNQSFKTQKKFAIAESIVNIAGGVAKALNNPYPANLAFAAQVAAQGAGLLATIKSSQPSSSGGVSVSGSSAIATPSSTSATTATAASSTTQTRVIDIRGIENGQSVTLTKEELLSLLQDDEDVQIAVNSGQSQAKRVGAI